MQGKGRAMAVPTQRKRSRGHPAPLSSCACIYLMTDDRLSMREGGGRSASHRCCRCCRGRDGRRCKYAHHRCSSCLQPWPSGYTAGDGRPPACCCHEHAASSSTGHPTLISILAESNPRRLQTSRMAERLMRYHDEYHMRCVGVWVRLVTALPLLGPGTEQQRARQPTG